jgi:multicomponent Na+:H+ antiporter subunit G
MRVLLASAAVLSGAAFMFVAALGVARLPDLYTRMQAATKASTVGVVGMMLAVGVAEYEASATVRAALIAGFFLLTSPIAAHAIARSALTRDIPLAPGTRIDLGARSRFRPGAPQPGVRPDEADVAGAPPAERARAEERP